jgi:iron complex outermembrane receptor protein
VFCSLNFTPSFFDNHLRVELSAKGMTNNNKFANQGAIGGSLSMDPTQSADFLWKNPDGTPLFVAPMNPLTQLNDYNDVSTVNRLLGNLTLEYKMHFFPALKAKLNLGLDKSNSDGSVGIPVDSFLSYSTYADGRILSTSRQNQFTFISILIIQVSSALCRLNAVAGYSWQHFYRDSNTITKSIK